MFWPRQHPPAPKTTIAKTTIAKQTTAKTTSAAVTTRSRSKSVLLSSSAPVPTPTSSAAPTPPPTSPDLDGFTVVQRPRSRSRRNSTASTSSQSSTASNSSKRSSSQRVTSVTVSDIPERFANQKEVSKDISGLSLNPLSLVVYRDRRATVKARAENIAQLLLPLRDLFSHPVKIVSSSSTRSTNPQPPSTSNPIFSCVVRNVDDSFTAEDLLSVFKDLNLNVLSTWRIQSKASNQPTSMFRILTKCPKTLDSLLSDGFCMYHRRYRCEPSRIPSAQPLQCGRCMAFGHPGNIPISPAPEPSSAGTVAVPTRLTATSVLCALNLRISPLPPEQLLFAPCLLCLPRLTSRLPRGPPSRRGLLRESLT